MTLMRPMDSFQGLAHHHFTGDDVNYLYYIYMAHTSGTESLDAGICRYNPKAN